MGIVIFMDNGRKHFQNMYTYKSFSEHTALIEADL